MLLEINAASEEMDLPETRRGVTKRDLPGCRTVEATDDKDHPVENGGCKVTAWSVHLRDEYPLARRATVPLN